jgi:hypothetical protein
MLVSVTQYVNPLITKNESQTVAQLWWVPNAEYVYGMIVRVSLNTMATVKRACTCLNK